MLPDGIHYTFSYLVISLKIFSYCCIAYCLKHSLHIYIYISLFAALLALSVVSSPSCFNDQKLSYIPANHLSQNKTKPWVFGHKGNPKEYQENTIEGFQSLVALKADGLAADTFLTNDGQLVLFRDENALVNFHYYIFQI